MTNKFKVGDKVVFVSERQHRDDPRHKPPVGTVGTITGDAACGVLWVQWPTGSTTDDDRWACNDDYLKLYSKFESKILITTNGTITTATLFDGKQKVKSAEAKCAPDDKFDFNTGAKLAFDRLMGREVKSTPKQDKPSFDWNAFKAGKIAVHCDTEKKAKAFLRECKAVGITHWMGFIKINDSTMWDGAGEYTYYAFYKNVFGFGLAHGDTREKGVLRYHSLIDYPFTK